MAVTVEITSGWRLIISHLLPPLEKAVENLCANGKAGVVRLAIGGSGLFLEFSCCLRLIGHAKIGGKS